jgi:hypothetical protein
MHIDQLESQYRGTTLPRLVESHIKKMDQPTRQIAIQAIYANFSHAVGPQVDAFALEYPAKWFNEKLKTRDLGELFKEAIEDIQQKGKGANWGLSDELVFEIFNLMVLRLSYHAYENRGFRKTLGIKKGWFS